MVFGRSVARGSPSDAEVTPTLSAIIVSHNSGEDLDRCVRSILDQACDCEVIVVDNGSSDGSVERVSATYAAVRVVSDGTNDGFAGGANRGAAAARGELFFFLNPDVVVEPGCATALVSYMRGASSAVVCSPVVADHARETLEYGLTIDFLGDPIGLTSRADPLYLSGCALATTRTEFTALGGFDTSFFMFCEDLDFCWRAVLHDCQVMVVDTAHVSHRGGGSTSGGYVSDGRVNVTAFRIALRERNTLATLIKCGPLAWVALLLPVRLLRMVFIAVIALATGRADLAGSLVAAFIWNVRRFPELIRQRRSIPASSALRWRVLRSRMVRDINSLRVLWRYGFPRFVDAGPN